MDSYLLESLDSLSLQKKRESLIRENHFEDIPVQIYDVSEVPLASALEDLDTYGLFSNKKVIIIQNIETLKYEDFAKDFEHLFHYIENPNPDYLLIIETKKLNNTLKTTKTLKKICKYESVSLDSKALIKEELKGYKIDSSAIMLLEEYSLGDITKISNECAKLREYKFDEKVITKKDIEELVVKKLGDSKDLVFAFTRSLAMKDTKDALEKYRELLSYQLEPFGIIGLLASQYRIAYQVKVLAEKHLKDKEIAEILGEKSDYRIKKTREITSLYAENEILECLKKLANIDYQLKTSDVDANHLLEMFILNI